MKGTGEDHGVVIRPGVAGGLGLLPLCPPALAPHWKVLVIFSSTPLGKHMWRGL